MNAQQLKNSILQMAVSGKLVPQDPNDEPASVLLKRIRAKKEALIKAGKIKREKNPSYIFRGSDNTPYEKIGNNAPVSIADEIPFDIPDSWEWCRISSISAVVTKGTTPRGGNVAYLDTGIGFLRAENVAGLDKLNKMSLNYIDETTHNEFLKRSILEPNDILITIAGTLGRTALVRKDDLPLNANQAISIIRLVNAVDMDLLYVIYTLNSPVIQKFLTTQKKITAIPNLTLEIISECLVPVPPLAEQHRIVKKIKEIMPCFEKYAVTEIHLDSLNTQFPNQLKKSILQQAVQGKLVPQDLNDEPASVLLERIHAEKERLITEGKIKRDKNESVIYKRDNSHYEKINGIERCIDDEIPFDIPDSWEWVRLFSFGQFSSGKTPSMADLKNWNGTIPWVSAKDMKNPVIMDSEMHITAFAAKSMQLYPKGTLLLVARSGILRRKLPLCVLGVNSTINQDIKAFQLYDSDLSEWLYYALEAYEPMILHDLVKSVTTVESLRFDEFSKMLIPLPSLNE